MKVGCKDALLLLRYTNNPDIIVHKLALESQEVYMGETLDVELSIIAREEVKIVDGEKYERATFLLKSER